MEDDSDVWGKDEYCNACRVKCADEYDKQEHRKTETHLRKWNLHKFFSSSHIHGTVAISEMLERYKLKKMHVVGLHQCQEIQQIGLPDHEKANFWTCNICYEAGATFESADAHLNSMVHIRNYMMAGRLREMRCELSFLKNADGSACFSQGSTCIWASCSGPGDVHASKANEEAMTLDISYRANCGDNKFSVLNNIIQSTLSKAINLELFPHTGLVVTIHGIQDDGSMGAVALNGACFALLDNGMPFETVFCGVLIVRVKDELIIDPTAKQETASTGKVLFAVCKGTDGFPEVCSMDVIGNWDYLQLEAAWSLAQPSASAIFEFYTSVMKRKHSVDEH